MDDMLLRPAAGVEEDRTRIDIVPWLERARRGRFKAWFATVKAALVQPARLGAALPDEGRTGQAWWFAIVSQFATMLAVALPSMCIFSLLPLFITGNTQQVPPLRILGVMAGISAFWLVGGFVFAIGHLLVWGAVCHGVLRATGACAGTIGRTYQALCYSSGANVISAVPCAGPYCGWIWWLVSAVLAVKDAQEIRGPRAAVAVLALPGAVLALLMVLYVGIFAAALAGTTTSGGTVVIPPVISAGSETQRVTDELRSHMDEHLGAGPAHLAFLSVDGPGAAMFISAGSDTTMEQVPIADTTLDQYRTKGPGRRAEIAARAADALPPEVVAHRLGDLVYTGHRIRGDDDGGLWLVVLTFDPDVEHMTTLDPIVFGRLDGTVERCPVAELPVALARQNELRATHHLPPLPDPRMITHADPAR
jgi:hypothetical protein